MSNKKFFLKKLAFTYIELLIVVLIIWIFTSVWISSFSNFFNDQEIWNIWSRITNYLWQLDDMTEAWEISSYKVEFSTWSNYIKINKNFYKNNYIIDDDIKNFSGKVYTNNYSTWTWDYRIYLDWENGWHWSSDFSWWVFDFYLSWNVNYEKVLINWYVDYSNNTNSIEFFALKPQQIINEINTEIVWIKWDSDLWNLEIINIMWSKKFYSNGEELSKREFEILVSNNKKETKILIK